MQAGQLRHRITVYRPLDPSETTQDSLGRDQGSPEEIGSFWCRVEPLQGRELESQRQRWASARYKIALRRQSGVTFSGKMYAEWGSRRLNILDVQDVGEAMRPMVTLLAEEYEGVPE